jgi:hypothetical protein
LNLDEVEKRGTGMVGVLSVVPMNVMVSREDSRSFYERKAGIE